MEIIKDIFGDGEELNALQMSSRTIVIFLFCLLFLRISGRRSFGMRMPIDNVITILMGAILSRAVVGVSPFFPVLAAAGTIALLHRVFGLLAYHNSTAGKILKGREKTLYEDGKTMHENMKRCMISERDMQESVRLKTNHSSMDKVDKVIMERNGDMSIIEKEN
jgi:uncharacterized membrane protein YcaP (DUF421 family)